MTETPQKRHRRTAEERLADLERQKIDLLEKQRAMLAKLEAEKAKLQTPALRKEQQERQKRFQWALTALAPHWDERQVLAAVERCLSEDSDALAGRGEELLEEQGNPRRGRPSRKA